MRHVSSGQTTLFTPHHIRPSSWILCLADDLTGALEAGAKFSACGLQARVTTSCVLAGRPTSGVLVIDTETRHLSEEQCLQLIHRVATEASQWAPALVYKKTDSTLRGNIAAELRALQTVFPDVPLFYAPAYVAMGRTVKDGHVYVNGTLLHETEFAHDPLNPVRESDVKALLRNQSILVLDGQSHAEAQAAARLILQSAPRPLCAGPAALAEALALELRGQFPPVTVLPRLARCLVVNGSLHPVSQQQASSLPPDWVLLDQHVPGKGLERARGVGERVRDILASSHFDGLVVFGGDTAGGIHRALNAPDFESCGEVLPGVPVSRCGDWWWITKAGGFGPPDLLHRLHARLTRDTC